MKYNEIKSFARMLRLNPTPAEVVLWRFLSKKQLDGRRFLRQHPIIYDSKNNNHAFFVPDFYCRSEMLIIELDGPVHNSRKEYDKHRDEILASMGYKILRIKNKELDNIEDVLSKIRSQLRKSSPPCMQGGARGG